MLLSIGILSFCCGFLFCYALFNRKARILKKLLVIALNIGSLKMGNKKIPPEMVKEFQEVHKEYKQIDKGIWAI